MNGYVARNFIQLHSCGARGKVLTSQLNITLRRMHDLPVINHAGRLVSEIGVLCSALRFIQNEVKLVLVPLWSCLRAQTSLQEFSSFCNVFHLPTFAIYMHDIFYAGGMGSSRYADDPQHPPQHNNAECTHQPIV